MTQTELGERTGLGKAAISSKELGRNAIRPSEHRKFAEAFGMSVQQFREAAENFQVYQGQRTVVGRIPIINAVRAGVSFDPASTQLDEADIAKYMETIDRGGIVHPNAYAVKVSGDSMEPRIPNGSVAVCEPLLAPSDKAKLQDGAVVVVCVEVAAGRSYQIGRFAWDGAKKFRLLKDNAAYPPQSYALSNEVVQRIGIVVEVRFKP